MAANPNARVVVANYHPPPPPHAPYGNVARVCPKVPGLNAQPMALPGIGATPWRTNANATPRVRGVGTAVPTGGRGTRAQQPRASHTPRKRKRKPANTAPTATQLHAAWAKGNLY